MSISEHPSDQTLEQYRARSLAPQETLALNDHIVSCPGCLSRLNSRHERSIDVPRLIEFDVENSDLDIAYEHLQAYVDDELREADRRALEQHLAGCARCAEDVADLRAMKAPGTSHPARTPATTPAPSAAFGRASLLLGRQPYRAMASGAALVALAALSVWVVTAPLRHDVARLRDQISSLSAAGEASHEQYSAKLSEVEGTVANLERQLGEQRDLMESSGAGSVILQDGGRLISLDRDGSLKGFESLPQDLQSVVRAGLQKSSASIPSLSSLAGERGPVMGTHTGTESFALKAPVGVVIEQTEPLFVWEGMRDAATYQVIVTGDRFTQVLASEPVSDTQWRATAALARGKTYTWQVKARLKDGTEVLSPAPTEPAAKFRIVSARDEEALQLARRLYPGSHLLLGMVYAKAGLISSAQQEFRALAEANPRSTIAQKLLESVERRHHGNGSSSD
jgi:hypothetical protein